jgi:hypothetical protein
VQGTVDLGNGSNLASIIGNPSANLRLTNFQAEASVVPQYALRVGFREQLSGTYTNLIGGDVIDACVDDAYGSAVPAGQDEIVFCRGILGF